MKPKIDLNSPITKMALMLQQNEMKKAWEMEQTVEKAVIPIYSVPKSKAHQEIKTKPEQIGTGVLVNIKTEYFIFSTTHVFAEFDSKSILTGTLEYSPVEEIIGERFSSGNLDNRIDKYDATVFHIQSEISEFLKKIAITLVDFDFEGCDSLNPIYMITGFRAKESNTSGNEIKSKARNYPTVEIDDYLEYGYDKTRQIVLAYPNQTLVDGKWQTSPKPIGMSGGAIIKAQGTTLRIKKTERKTEKQLLSAITIEQHRDQGDKLGILLGTRVNVHLGLIHQCMPGLLDDFLKEYNEKKVPNN
ncbi:MAG: hypothetical protein JKX79_08320 [Labilibaculum sp.]|nr:hypothetical protein [Labilibaculum sp.]